MTETDNLAAYVLVGNCRDPEQHLSMVRANVSRLSRTTPQTPCARGCHGFDGSFRRKRKQ